MSPFLRARVARYPIPHGRRPVDELAAPQAVALRPEQRVAQAEPAGGNVSHQPGVVETVVEQGPGLGTHLPPPVAVERLSTAPPGAESCAQRHTATVSQAAGKESSQEA